MVEGRGRGGGGGLPKHLLCKEHLSERGIYHKIPNTL